METRADVLRRRSRRIFGWSFGIAVCLHVAAFIFWPEIRVDPYLTAAAKEEVADVEDDLPRVPVHARFGPPLIRNPAGGWVEEPPDRTLQADRAIYVVPSCLGGELTVRGRVRMQINSEGRVDWLWVVESSGSTCGDERVRAVAGDLWYRWLPDERFPAPVELVQPVSLTVIGADA